MRTKTYHFLLFMLLLLTTVSCASYSGKRIKDIKMSKQDMTPGLLEGTFVMSHYDSYTKSGPIASDSLRKMKEIYHFFDVKDPFYDSLSNYTLRTKIQSKRVLSVQLYRDSLLIDTKLINGKLKNNGMFHFKEQTLDCRGIPFILGGCEHSKKRIGLTKDKDLLLQYAYSSDAAFLLIFGGSVSFDKAFVFKRITL